MVGCVAGAVTAVGWFVVTTVVRKIGLLAWILDQHPTRMFRMRDLVIEEDLCQAGWEKWESKRLSSESAKGKKSR
jgi:dolichyldiphosphatase